MVNNRSRLYVPPQARGSALLTALFIMTLVAIATTAMTTRLHLDIYRTRLTIKSDKLYLASQGVTFWAMDLLSKKLKSPFPNEIEFPSSLTTLYPEVETRGKLIDLQAYFNINNLQDRKYRPQFDKLLEIVLPKLDKQERRAIVFATESWVKNYHPGRGQDKRLNFYLTHSPAYFPSHQPMKSVSEFRLVKGVTGPYYQMLEPFIVALPTKTPINLYTAPKPVLLALGINDSQINDLKMLLDENGAQGVRKINAKLQELNISKELVTTESQYYLSQAMTTSDSLTLTTYSLIKRSKDRKGKISVSIEVESLNTL